MNALVLLPQREGERGREGVAWGCREIQSSDLQFLFYQTTEMATELDLNRNHINKVTKRFIFQVPCRAIAN